MVKWGVLGTADILADQLAAGMQQAEKCEMYAIAGRNPEKTRDFKERFGFEVAYDSFDELLADPQVQVVYIPLPNAMHREWTVKALNAGKHVLCEKPMAATVEEAQAMFAAAHANNVVLMEAFAYQHGPYLQAIRDELDAGAIGDIRYMEAALVTSDYPAGNIRLRRETLGGSIYDVGAYCASIILRLLGREPRDIHATALFSEAGVDLYTTAIMDYEGGIRASIDCGLVLETTPFTSINRFQIHGTKGSIQSGRFAFNLPGVLTYKVRTHDGRKETVAIEMPNNYLLEVEQMCRCVEEGEAPFVTEEFTIANTRTLERLAQAVGY